MFIHFPSFSMAKLNYQRVAGPLGCCSIVLQDGLAIGRKYAGQAIGNTDDKGSDAIVMSPLHPCEDDKVPLSAPYFGLLLRLCALQLLGKLWSRNLVEVI